MGLITPVVNPKRNRLRYKCTLIYRSDGNYHNLCRWGLCHHQCARPEYQGTKIKFLDSYMTFQKGHKGFRTKQSYIEGGKKISQTREGKPLSKEHRKNLRKPKSKTDLYKGSGLFGKDHQNWKGDNVGYRSLHIWVESRLGKPTTCVNCKEGNLNGHKIHWANLSGKYKRKKNDWIRLCASCHKAFDLGRGVRP